jgi:hypothetical protein
MLKKINFVSLFGAILCFVFAYAIGNGITGIVFSSVESEMFTFALACTAGCLFLAAVTKTK